MSISIYENPRWIRDVVSSRTLRRRPLGALRSDYSFFMRQFNVRAVSFEAIDPIEVPGSEAVVEVIKKEYFNKSNQEHEDSVEIKGQKTSSETTTRNYQLTVGTQQSNQVSVGGSLGLDASFFNLAGPGVGLKAGVSASTTSTKTNSEQIQVGNEKSATLGKEYSITGNIKIPAKTKLEVTITTCSVNFRIPGVQVIISAPASACLKVHLRRMCPCQSRALYVTAEDYLKVLCGKDSVMKVGDMVQATQATQLTYLGEKTKVSKVATRIA